MAGLISFDVAAERLGVGEAELFELLDAGKLTLRRDGGDVWLDAEEVAALAKKVKSCGGEEVKNATSGDEGEGEDEDEDDSKPVLPLRGQGADRRYKDQALANCKLARIREMRGSGVAEVTATEAARLLGVSQRQVYHLLREGRLNGEKRGRNRWIDMMEVEFYAMDQAHWERMDGAWTAYGKQARKAPDAGMVLAAKAIANCKLEIENCKLTIDHCQLDMRRAAEVLGVAPVTVHRFARMGMLPFERTRRRDPEGSKRRITREILTFALADVLALADRRERRAWRRGISPKEWRMQCAERPVIRTEIEAPPNDTLISPADAARILGVGAANVSGLVARGRLFGWQKHPGKHGCRLWLSENQVRRYASDPERLKRRGACSRGPREASPPGMETNDEMWREEMGIAAGVLFGKRSTLDRDYGEFFNARQTARELGISVSAVGALRRRKRLNGYQTPRKKRDGGGGKWWFYRKDEVYELLADGEYLRNRDRGQRGKLLSIGREMPRMDAEWE